MSNYSEVLKKAFPASSEIRSNESSNGAILFDALGKDLENITTESIRKAEMYHSEGSWLNAPGEVYLYKKETSDFLESLEGYKRSNTFEHFFTDLSEAVKYNFNKLNSFEEVSITSTLETRTFVEDYLKIDVYELSSINKKNIKDREEDIVLGIFLRGVDYFNNKVEEFIPIEEEGLYISKTKFLYLEPLEYIKSLNISGGPAVEAVGADNFSYKISNKYYRDWVGSGEVKTKTLRSKKTSFKMQEAQNEAKLEEAYAKYVIEKDDSSTKVKCIHRIFGLNRYYKNIRYENIQDEVEEITYEIELVDNLGASISLVDCCYSEKYEKLFAITSNGKLLAYDISPGSFILGAHERSREADLKIDVDLRRPHQSEIVNLRVFTSSPTFYTDYFIVVRHDRTSNTYSTLIDKAYDEENGEYIWASDASINYLHGLANIEENQDSVLITSFEDTVEQGQIDYYALNVRNKKIFNDAIGDLTFFSDSKFSDMEKLRNAAVKSGGSCYRTSILSSKTKPVYEMLLSSEGIENTAKLNIKRIDHSIEVSESSDGESIFKETRNYYIQENKNIYFLKNNPDVVINENNIDGNNVSKILLGTKVDNLGLMYGLSREEEESLEDFWKRVEISKTLDYRLDIDSLSYSLLYKRQSKAKAEFCILFTGDKKIEFLSSGISIENILYSYKEYKFNKDLLGLFDVSGITYQKLKDYNEWTRCKFLSRLSLEKLQVNEEISGKRNALSQTAVEVYSNVEGLSSTSDGEDTGFSTYSFDNNRNIIWLNNDAPVKFNYRYRNVPLVIWSCDSNWFSLEDKDLDYRIKEKDYTLSDEKMILTQEGVKVINKVLKHYNYYWGQ